MAKKYDFCPNCSIGLNNQEMTLRFCQNCKHSWGEDDDEDDEFSECEMCDGHEACTDFGCAYKLGLGHMVKED